MKKILFSLAAIAAMVGCQGTDEPIVNVNNETLALEASIVVDATRVAVAGEKFTDVSWVEGDVIRLESERGMKATLSATASGKSDVRFEGIGAAVADIDTYYAVYPDMNVSNGTITMNYAQQQGEDVALLVAKAEECGIAGLQMSFRPLNALLHVAVSGAQELKSAEFKSFTGAAVTSQFTYNFDTDAVTYGATAAALVVEKPNAEGFFFRLPADLDMSEGYIISLTDVNNNVCSKAYNGKVFERGTTTRVDIAWSVPTVALGEPMTSYSYYAAGQAATANGCANNVIYFPNASSYANVQNAMIAEAGVFVDGTAYAATLDTATKSFTPASVTVSSWKEYKVESYIKTKDGHIYKSAPQTVHITGLPYHADWRSKDYSDWKYVSVLDLGNSLQVEDAKTSWTQWLASKLGCIISPEFKVPGNTSVTSAIAASTNATQAGNYDKSYAYVGTQNSSATESGAVATIGYVSDFSGAVSDTPLVKHNANLTLTTSTPCVVMTAKDFSPACYTYIYQAQITYAE
ncbi:MAG: hypothetical protein IJB03_03860 [Alistipes sp.]|nr:hypothetical protein [Alistipes sp.]